MIAALLLCSSHLPISALQIGAKGTLLHDQSKAFPFISRQECFDVSAGVVRRFHSEGPQHLTVHGQDEVVIISIDEFRRLKGDLTGEVLIAAMQTSPYRQIDIEPSRISMPVRIMFKWRLLVEDGRKVGHTFSQPDPIIAATALHHGPTVVSRDVSDYQKAHVPVFNPWIDLLPGRDATG